jgi:hypothetical protein
MHAPRCTNPGRRAGARGLALIDIVIALGIVLVLGGLAIPTLIGLVTKSAMQDGAGRIESIASICRAEAMRRGCLVELAFRMDENGGVVLLGRRRDALPAAGDDADLLTSGAEDEAGSWPAFLVEPLPAKVELVLDTPGETPPDEDEGFLAGELIEKPAARAGVIAVFLPSGAASSGARRWIVRVRGSGEATLAVNAWTGSVRVEARGTPTAPTPSSRTSEGGPDDLNGSILPSGEGGAP